ncbi:MAG: twin-arginine translocation signal domain-containing protein, partial [Candidatus Acidiferrales bacterium]
MEGTSRRDFLSTLGATGLLALFPLERTEPE